MPVKPHESRPGGSPAGRGAMSSKLPFGFFLAVGGVFLGGGIAPIMARLRSGRHLGHSLGYTAGDSLWAIRHYGR